MTDAFIPTHRLKPREVQIRPAIFGEVIKTSYGLTFTAQVDELVVTDAEGDVWLAEPELIADMYEAI